jgi:hypothetical protein
MCVTADKLAHTHTDTSHTHNAQQVAVMFRNLVRGTDPLFVIKLTPQGNYVFFGLVRENGNVA